MADVFSKRKRSEVVSRIRGRGQNPKSCGVRPDWRTMERVVPMGNSFLGWGTMAIRPVAFLYLAWLPRWVMNENPCSSSTRMTSLEPRRLGMNEFLPHAGFTHGRKGAGSPAFKIKFNRLLQIGHGFLPRGSKTGHVHVEALGDEKFVLPVDDVVHLFHGMNVSARADNCNHAWRLFKTETVRGHVADSWPRFRIA